MANGCYVVPSGWNLVGFVGGNPSATCFANSTPSSVVEGPSGGTCTCGCSVKSNWTCPSGPISVTYDDPGLGGSGCNLAGQPATMNNMGPCATDMYTGNPVGYTQLDLEYTAPAATGGSCMTSATPDPASVTYAAQDTYCTPSTPLCTPNTPCMPNLGTGYSVCIEQSGDVACPGTTFTQKFTVGTGATFGCGSGCGCTTPQPTCTGTMKFYTDMMCNMGEYSYPANACTAPGGGEQNQYRSYHYVADPAPATTCTNSGSSSATNLALSNPTTICCAP